MAGPVLNTRNNNNNNINSTITTIKFLCSYGGKILPRYPDGKLRYHGGHTRVLSVDRSISFSELLAKLSELCGSSASLSLRCQLPTEDLDALVSITCDEDLVNLIEEYDLQSIRQSKPLKIRAFLSLPNRRRLSPSLSPSTTSGSSSSISTTTNDAGSPRSPLSSIARYPVTASNRCLYHVSKPPVPYKLAGNPSRSYLVHHGNYWQ